MFSKRNICRVALGASLLLIACSANTPDGPNPGAIQPGQGVKEVVLFDTQEKVEKSLGQPETVTKNPFNPSNVIVQYPSQGLEISYLDGAVGSILLYSSGSKDGITWQAYQGSTAEGLWPESSLKTIKAKLGQPLKELPQAVVYPGLWIRLDSKGEVDSFSISKDEANQLKELGD